MAAPSRQLLKESVFQAVQTYATEEWELVKSEDDIKISKKKFPGQPAAFKADIELTDMTAEDILSTFYVNRKQWDDTIHPDSGVVEVLSECERVTRDITLPAAGGLISSRDFINFATWGYANDEKTIFIEGGCATEHASWPEVKGFVRGVVHPSGVWLKRDSAESKNWHMCYIIHADIKGWLPTSLVEGSLSGAMLQYLKSYRAFLAGKS